MKTLNTVMILALALLNTAVALATEPTCDLTILPEIIERRNPVTAEIFWSGTDRTRGERRRDYPYFFREHVMGEVPRHLVGSETNSYEWYEIKKSEAIAECQNYIRENFASDIIQDTQDLLVARHYHCEHRREEGRNRVSIGATLVRSQPVYAEMTLEQALAKKCQKLTQCLIEANDATQFEQLQQTQIQLGCQ